MTFESGSSVQHSSSPEQITHLGSFQHAVFDSSSYVRLKCYFMFGMSLSGLRLVHGTHRNSYKSRIIITTSRLRQAPILILISRRYTTKGQLQHPIVHIATGSYIYAFGAPSHTRTPLLRDLGWTINDGEAWAVISGGGGRDKNIIFNVRSLFI